jgi:peptidoglycan hydrolase-like protein with peptidoglycan-binding domain
MSVEAFSSLSFQAGGAVAAAAGRTAMWAIGAYMRAPLRNTALAALVGFSALAGANALYNQSGHHPAPLFGSFDGRAQSVAATPEPVVPADRPARLFQQATVETTGSIATPEATPAETIGNADVFEIQRKLTAFALYDGKLDGLFGPRTARSIRAFEEKVGRPPTGKLTPEIVELIKATPIIAEPAPVAAIAETPVLALEAPAPLVAAAAEPVGGAGVSALEMTSPPAAAPTKRTVETIAVRVETPAPAAEVVTTPIDVVKAATDPKVVSAVQRGLSSLGFLHGTIDGVAGEATAKAIRNFEVYYNYNGTGRITPELINLLAQNGAVL